MRFNFSQSAISAIERTALFFVLFWGNWAIYYWIVVLVFDGSYLALKHFAPIYLLQLAVSFYCCARLGLHPVIAGESLMPHERVPGTGCRVKNLRVR